MTKGWTLIDIIQHNVRREKQQIVDYVKKKNYAIVLDLLSDQKRAVWRHEFSLEGILAFEYPNYGGRISRNWFCDIKKCNSWEGGQGLEIPHSAH